MGRYECSFPECVHPAESVVHVHWQEAEGDHEPNAECHPFQPPADPRPDDAPCVCHPRESRHPAEYPCVPWEPDDAPPLTGESEALSAMVSGWWDPGDWKGHREFDDHLRRIERAAAERQAGESVEWWKAAQDARAEVARLREALAGLWDAANDYRHAVADANRYLNEDMPSARSLVRALGRARAAGRAERE